MVMATVRENLTESQNPVTASFDEFPIMQAGEYGGDCHDRQVALDGEVQESTEADHEFSHGDGEDDSAQADEDDQSFESEADVKFLCLFFHSETSRPLL